MEWGSCYGTIGCPLKYTKLYTVWRIWRTNDHDSNLTEQFQVTTGVKQGCVLSYTLFLIVIDWG